jgi:hypothetical protein
MLNHRHKRILIPVLFVEEMNFIRPNAPSGRQNPREFPNGINLSPDTRVLNVTVGFEDALKLNLAIDECVRQLNRYNRALHSGRQMGVSLIIF